MDSSNSPSAGGLGHADPTQKAGSTLPSLSANARQGLSDKGDLGFQASDLGPTTDGAVEYPPDMEEQAWKRKKQTRVRRWLQALTHPDWVAAWAGVVCCVGCVVLCFSSCFEAGTPHSKHLVPQPVEWGACSLGLRRTLVAQDVTCTEIRFDPFDAWDHYSACYVWLLLLMMLSLYLVACWAMGKIHLQSAGLRSRVAGFTGLFLASALCLWLGENRTAALYGGNYTTISLIGGMIARGVLGDIPVLLQVGQDADLFIKVGLVLYARDFLILLALGPPGVIVAWLGSPLAVLFGYLFAVRVCKTESKLAMLLAVGASWCGVSAITAVKPLVGAKDEEVATATCIVLAFTVIFTIVQPLFALAVGMDETVAGAWLGASIDQTGNVIGAAEIVSPAAAEVAALVKVILNSGIGFIALAVSWAWALPGSEGQRRCTPRQALANVWAKFPKFVVGYLTVALMLTIALPFMQGSAAAYALPRALKSMSDWWFCIGFVGLGYSVDMAVQARQYGRNLRAVASYLGANFFDMAVGFLLAWALFQVAFETRHEFEDALDDLRLVKTANSPACGEPYLSAVFQLHDRQWQSPLAEVFGVDGVFPHHKSGQAEILWARGDVWKRLARTHMKFALVTFQGPSGTLRNPHWHPNAHETAYVVSGRCRMSVQWGPAPELRGQAHSAERPTEVLTAGAGGVSVAPVGYGHWFENAGDCVILLAFRLTEGDLRTFDLGPSLANLPKDVLGHALGWEDAAADGMKAVLDRRFVFDRPREESRSVDTRAPHRFISADIRQSITWNAQHTVGARLVPLWASLSYPDSFVEWPSRWEQGLDVALMYVELAAGAMIKPYWVDNADEVVYIIQGEVEIGRADGARPSPGSGEWALNEGHMFLCEQGMTCWIWNRASTKASLLRFFNSGQPTITDVHEHMLGLPEEVRQSALHFGITPSGAVARI